MDRLLCSIQTTVDPQPVLLLSGERSITMCYMFPMPVIPELFLAIMGKLRDFQRTIKLLIHRKLRESKLKVGRSWMGASVVV
jgi:hypothetical protein